MPKYKCQSCGAIFYGWAEQGTCQFCGGILKAVTEGKKEVKKDVSSTKI